MRATRSLGKLVLAGSMAAAAMGLFSLPASAAAPLCDQRVFQEFWCGDNPFVSLPYKSICWQYWYCGDGKPAGRTPSGCDFICDLDTYVRHTRPAEPCPEHQGSDERCGNGLDDDWDGCVDEDCTIGEPPCTCTGRCDEPACSPPPHSTCDPFRPNEPEICGNGEDDNCSGQVDEGCWPKRECQANVGSDPIVLASRAAVTTPFADFSVTAVSRLSLTRIYSSADASIVGGAAPGPFGRGWHHEWEASLSCREGVCTVRRGLETGLRYGGAGSARSLDGTETWDIYRAYADETGMKYDAPGVLARRPTGEWILFGADGGEQHFQTVCDACDGADLASPRCLDPLLGGTARLVKVVDAAGNAVHLGYDRPSGLLFGLFDDLGHALEARSATACADGLARELRYDGSPVAAYEYDGVDLVRASDADGSTLRAYAYHPGSGGRLQAVLDEARTAVAEFGYDAAWRATGIIDGESSAAVDYDAPGGAAVTEFFQGEAGPTTATSLRQLDRNGNVVSVSDGCACGAPRTYAYTDGRMTCSADAQGGVVGQEFDAEGRLTRRVEYSGSCPVPSSLPLPSRDERRAYGVTRTVAEGILVDLDRVTGVTRKSRLYTSGIAEESFDYDPAPKAIDPAGYACTEAPLPAGSVVCRRIESGYVTVGSSKVLERHATFLSYDGRGRLVRSVGPLNLDRPSASDVTPVEERTYWADTDLLQRRGRLREVKRYETPEGAPLVTSYDHDAFGVYQAREPDGATTTYVKDGRGRVRFVLEAGGQTETRYHAGSDPRVVVGPSGATTRSSYGALGRLEKVEWLSADPDAAGSTAVVLWSEVHQYDASGNRVLTERRDGAGTATWRQERAFDVQHRIVTEWHPELPGTARLFAYDSAGFLTGTADEEGRGTTFLPDALGRVATVRRSGVDALGAPISLDVARYTYQTNSDELSSVTDAKGAKADYRRDDFGRLELLQDPYVLRGGYATLTSDARGNLLQRKDNYVTVSYMYDGLDRVKSVTATSSADASSVAYTYTYDAPGAEGRLSSTSDAARTVSYVYDAAGRLASETLTEAGAPPLVAEYRYGADGSLAEIWYPSGLKVRHVRDPGTKEVVAVENVADGTRYASGVVHAPGGALSALTFGNGLALAQTRNLRGEPVSVASGPVSLSYGTSPAGDVAGISEATASRTFGYDFLDRLVESPGWLAYGYDGNGNRTSETVEGTGLSYAYSTDRVTKSTRAGTTSTRHIFAHDYQANVSAIVAYAPNGVTEGRLCLRHDALGRLALVGVASSSLYIGLDSFGCLRDSNVSQVLARFRYDGRNRRIARWTAAENRWTYVVSDPAGNPLSELALVNGAWTRVRDYVWLYGRPLAQIEYPGPAGSTEGYVYYFHVDAIGLPRALTNQTGQTVWSASARPYGDLVETATPDPVSGRTVVTNLRLPGQYDERLFASLGLQGPYYNWNRWYLPGVGRYLELDVLALEGKMNGDHAPDWYTYANSNPLTFIDPDGTMGQAIRDPGQCMKELRCPATITCGGETLNLVSCGYGSCSICPLENLFASAWCAYATPPGRCPEKTGGLFKPKLGRGPITGKWIGPICYP